MSVLIWKHDNESRGSQVRGCCYQAASRNQMALAGEGPHVGAWAEAMKGLRSLETLERNIPRAE